MNINQTLYDLFEKAKIAAEKGDNKEAARVCKVGMEAILESER